MSEAALVSSVAEVGYNQEIVDYLQSKFPGIEIRNFREIDLVEAYVPAEHIFTEDVAVDEAHVEELAEDIQKEIDNGRQSGQTLPVWLGEIDTFDRLPVIDGFHRSAAIARLESPMVYAVISLGTTWEKIIDERIIAANMHKSVRFSRVIEWVNDAWSRSPWNESINATQAFSLALKRDTRKTRLIDQSQVEPLQEWVAAKCKQWKLSAAVIHDYLSVSSIASPELMNEARERPSGHELKVITPSHLKAIASALPNKFELQELVASVCVANNLTVPLSRSLALKIAETDSLKKAREMIAPGLIDSLQPEYGNRKPGETRGRPMLSRNAGNNLKAGDALADKELVRTFFVDELEIAGLSLSNQIWRGRYIAPPIIERQPLTTHLSSSQRDMALRRVGLGDSSVWSARSIRSFGDLSKSLSDALTPQIIAKKGFSEEEAANILWAVKQRLAEDLKDGGLRFEELNDERLLRAIYMNCLNDEIKLRRRPAAEVTSSKEPPPLELTVVALENVLPKYDRRGRRAIVLNFVYNLSPFTTAQILGIPRAEVEALLPEISRNLKYQAAGFKKMINEEDL